MSREGARRRPKLRVPESIDGVIARAGENRFAPARPPIADHVWREAVGPRIADRARPVQLDRGVLTVRTATGVWATELSLLSTSLLERLHAAGIEAHELRFRVGAIEAPARPPERRASRAVPSPAPLPSELNASLSAVGDDELKAALARAARANLAWQAHTLSAGPPGARGPRSAGTGTGLPGRTSGASPEGSRCTRATEPRRPK